MWFKKIESVCNVEEECYSNSKLELSGKVL